MTDTGRASTAEQGRNGLAVVMVHYRTPELAREAVRALRCDLGESVRDTEWLLINNGCDREGEALLRELPVEVVDPGRNLGFAGGVNLGVARSRAGHVLLLNPDVMVRPGCVAALRARLRAGAGAAGPRFFWDHDERLLMPPAERRTRRDEIWARLALRSESWARGARRRWRRHARRHWSADGPMRSYELSGALLAVRRDCFDRVGPFDEGFQLYFEETDWLERLRRAEVPAEHVPEARAVHLYARSAQREPMARSWFEQSRERFERRHYGRWFTALTRMLTRRVPSKPSSGGTVCADRGTLRSLRLPQPSGEPVCVEIAPSREGYPAAAEWVRDAESWSLPDEVLARLEAGLYSLQVSDARGRELLRRHVVVGETPP